MNELYIYNSVFQEYADFRDTMILKLNYNSSVSPTIVNGRIDFRKATISEAHFQDVIFENDVDFSDAVFGIPLTMAMLDVLPKNIKFPESLKDRIKYNDRANYLVFIGVMSESDRDDLLNLSENVNYQKAVKKLFDQSYSGPLATVFRYVTFESDAYFLRTGFDGKTAFERVNFIRGANLTDAVFMERNETDEKTFSLSYLNFNNLLIKWDQFPKTKYWVRTTDERLKSSIEIEKENEQKDNKKAEPETSERLQPLSQVFTGLEANFRRNNQLSDANQAYYHIKRAELWESNNDDTFLSKFLKNSEWIFWGIPCGYGTKIWWILGWSAFFVFFFTIIYVTKGVITREYPPKAKREFIFKQRLFDLPKLYYARSEETSLDGVKSYDKFSWRKFICALRFSSVVLLKVGYRDTTIAGNIWGINSKYLVWTEWALGYYILAALAVTLSNTLPLVNRLITGVF
jgi:hypothetical protein